jgi:DNA replication initiation complex subunit (GINS family)
LINDGDFYEKMNAAISNLERNKEHLVKKYKEINEELYMSTSNGFKIIRSRLGLSQK